MEDEELKEQIKNKAIKNKGLIPFIDKNYWCKTCGSHSGECHLPSQITALFVILTTGSLKMSI